jgi:hypothetical protein
MSVRLNLEAFGTYKTTTNERKGRYIQQLSLLLKMKTFSKVIYNILKL